MLEYRHFPDFLEIQISIFSSFEYVEGKDQSENLFNVCYPCHNHAFPLHMYSGTLAENIIGFILLSASHVFRFLIDMLNIRLLILVLPLLRGFVI